MEDVSGQSTTIDEMNQDLRLLIGNDMVIGDDVPIFVPDDARTTSTPFNTYLYDTRLHTSKHIDESRREDVRKGNFCLCIWVFLVITHGCLCHSIPASYDL